MRRLRQGVAADRRGGEGSTAGGSVAGQAPTALVSPRSMVPRGTPEVGGRRGFGHKRKARRPTSTAIHERKRDDAALRKSS